MFLLRTQPPFLSESPVLMTDTREVSRDAGFSEHVMEEQRRADWTYGGAFLLLALVFGAGVAEEVDAIALFPLEVYVHGLWVLATCLWGFWAVTRWRA